MNLLKIPADQETSVFAANSGATRIANIINTVLFQ
jgi:hypothetical protein